jgi:hypothetical protein
MFGAGEVANVTVTSSSTRNHFIAPDPSIYIKPIASAPQLHAGDVSLGILHLYII